ncbi:MAG: CBS domain-containing protein [Acidobacteria bacterium]|nr:CBS domain-containing protein [Acidobacteriota bacterium]
MSRPPVVDKGKVVGVISIEDLIKCLVKGETEAKIKDKMTRDATVCHPDDPLIKAIQIFDRTGYGRLPVVEKESNKLAGILTKSDIVMCLFKKLRHLYETKEESEEESHKPIYSELKGNYIFRMERPVEKMNFKDAGSASSAFKEVMTKFGIPKDFIRRVSISAYEAEMNIVIYSEGGKMALEIHPEKIRIEAFDNGPGIEDVKKALTPGFSTAPDWIRELGFGAGMGLPNIQHNSDRLKIRTKRGKFTRISFEVYLK